MKQESNRQKTMEGIDGGLHPAVDRQQWRTTSCSGQTAVEDYILQWIDSSGGLHPAVDRQQWRTTFCSGQTAVEDYILQWMDKAFNEVKRVAG